MSAQPSKKSRRSLTMEAKLKILRAYDSKPNNVTQSDLAKSLDIPLTTLCGIVKNRSKIEEVIESGISLKKKTTRGAKFKDLETFLYEYFLECRKNNIPISGPNLRQKAEDLALKLNISDEFKASIGWLGNFKKRHNIGGVEICGEENDVDMAVVQDWHTVNDEKISRYAPKDRFNFDEVGLFYSALPDTTLGLIGEKCHGGKRSKVRVTVGLCVNQTGTEKIKPVFIAKSANPRCFKHVKKSNLPVTYEFNKKSWMNSKIFTQVVIRLERKMACENRKVAFIIDDAPCHNLDLESLNLQHVEIIYLPPNTTNKTQPLDKGIIQNVKVMYRRRLVKHYLKCIDIGCPISDIPKWTLLHAIRALIEAWRAVTLQTIRNCWRAAGFSCPQDPPAEEEETIQDFTVQQQQLAAEVALYLSKVPSENNDRISADTYLSMDNDVATCNTPGENQDEELMSSTDTESDEEDDENDVVVYPPKREEVLKAFQTLHQFNFTQETDDEFIDHLSKLEIKADYIMESNKTQKKITDFFK